MTFRNPLLLAGLAAVVLPLVLHLLGRAGARGVPWGAMDLVAGTDARRSRGQRLMYPLVLLLRCAVIAAVALTLARPARSVDADAGPAAVVLVVDGSPSMLHPQGDATRFELARRAALACLFRVRPGGQAGLIELGASPPAEVPLTTDLQTIATRLASLTTGPGAADQAEGQQRARDLLTAAGIDGGEIDLIGDRQKSAWADLSPGPAAGPRVVAVAVGTPTSENVVIESVTLLNPPAVAGRPAVFAAVVRNDGDLPQGDLPWRLSAGSSAAPVSGRLAVAAGGRTTLTRALTFDRTGPAVVTASVAGANLPGEPVARVAIDVIDPPRVRVLWTPAAASTTTRSSTEPATQPAPDKPPVPAWANGAGFRADVAVAAPASVAGAAVLLVSDAVPDGPTVAALESFVAAGGDLILAAGPHVTPAAWNRRLNKSGFGLAPAAADAVAATGAPTPQAALPAADPLAVDYTAVPLRRRLGLLPTRGETVLVACDGEPLVVARTYGRGQVIAVGMPLDGGWSTRPGDDTNAGLVESLVRRLVAPAADRNLDLNAPLETTAPWSRDRAAWIGRPDGRVDRVPLLPTGWAGLLRYTRTDRPGRYAVRVADRPPVDWVVRPDPAETNLAPMNDVELARVLAAANIELRGGAPTPGRFPVDATALLVGGIAVLLGAELLLGGRYLPPDIPAGTGR